MFGHFNINKDEKKFSYEYAKQIPIQLEGTIPGTQLKKWADEARTSVQFATVGVDKLYLRQVSLSDLQLSLEAFREVVQDLEELISQANP